MRVGGESPAAPRSLCDLRRSGTQLGTCRDALPTIPQDRLVVALRLYGASQPKGLKSTRLPLKRRILEAARQSRWPRSERPLSDTALSSLRPKRSEGLFAANNIALKNLTLGLSDLFQCVWVGQDCQRFLQRLKVVRTHEHCRRHSVARYDNAFMLAMNPFNEIREAIPHGPQRFSRHGHYCATPFG